MSLPTRDEQLQAIYRMTFALEAYVNSSNHVVDQLTALVDNEKRRLDLLEDYVLARLAELQQQIGK